MNFYALSYRESPCITHKFLLVMKLIVILLTASILQVSGKSFAQKISIDQKNISLEKVLDQIRAQAGYDFFYDLNIIKKAKPISVHLTNASLEEALKQCFASQPFTYTIEEKTVIVKPKEAPFENLAMLNLLVVKTINGKVINEKGEPLPGASVRLKETSIATLSDGKGEFQLKNVENSAILIVTYTGYNAREVTINADQTFVTITLTEDLKALNEVTVIGYGTQRRADITAAISSFKPTEENNRPVLGPDQLIQGRMAGVQVSAGSGSPGSSTRVSIRGIGSLSATNEPLYVIDGIPIIKQNAALFNMGENMNPLAELNPNDIESVEVLKDAASAAIYGSRATNGVIIITTKSGQAGKSKFGVDYYTGIQNVPNRGKIKMAGADQYLEVMNESIDNYNTQYQYKPGDKNYVLRMKNPYPGMPDTDWLGLVLRTAHTQNASLSFTGGTDKTKIYLSGNYLRQEGAIREQKLDKYTAKLNLSHKLYSWLEFGTNTNFSFTHNNRVPGSNLGSTIMNRALPQRPFDRPFKPNGDYYVGGTDDLIFHNPLQILNEENVYLDNYRFLGTLYGIASITKDLSFKTSFGTDLTYTLDNVYYSENHPYGTGVGRLIDSRRFTPNILWENTLNYNKTFGKLTLNALGGYSYQKFSTSSSSIDGRGFPSPSFDVLSVAAEITEASTGLTESALMSFFGRTNFNWDNKYLLMLSLRTDGSSKFSPDNRWGYFPAVSAGWNLSSEDFWSFKQTDVKLRASYGSTGNQDGISSYAYQAQMSGGRNYRNESGIGVSTNGNDDLTWETARQFGVGADLSFFSGKLNFTTDYFLKNTDNLLYSKPEPATTGFTSIISNIGSMRNKGWEFSVNGNIPLGKVQWSSDFNISFVKNRLTSLIGDEALLIGANRTLKVGEEVGSYFLFKQLGIYQRDDEIPTSLYNNGVRAGDVKYEDIDGNGAIDVNDRQVVGSSNPNFYGGWNNSFRFNNFDFNFFFTYSQGAEVYATWRTYTERLGNNLENMTVKAANERWTGPGTSNTTPRAIYGIGWNTQNSTRFLEDGSFIRLRSVNLGYTLPAKLTSRWKVNRVRIYAQADNLFLWTKYSGMDPEVTSDFDPQFMSDDNMILPQLRTINFGVNIGI